MLVPQVIDLDRERVSLSLKATQEDPWRLYARTHAIGQIVPGKVTKLVPFGAFVRVEEGIEGLVHISELAERHVEIPEQVVQVGDDAMVKVIFKQFDHEGDGHMESSELGAFLELLGMDPAPDKLEEILVSRSAAAKQQRGGKGGVGWLLGRSPPSPGIDAACSMLLVLALFGGLWSLGGAM